MVLGFFFAPLFVLFAFYAHGSLCLSQTVAESSGKAAGPKTRFPIFYLFLFISLQIGQFSHVDVFSETGDEMRF